MRFFCTHHCCCVWPKSCRKTWWEHPPMEAAWSWTLLLLPKSCLGLFSAHKYMGSKSCPCFVGPGYSTLEAEEMAYYFLRWWAYIGIVILLLFCLGRRNLLKIEGKKIMEVSCRVFSFSNKCRHNFQQIFFFFWKEQYWWYMRKYRYIHQVTSSKDLWQKMVSVVWISGCLLKLSLSSVSFCLEMMNVGNAVCSCPKDRRMINLSSLCTGGVGLSFPTFKSLSFAIYIIQSRTGHFINI